MTSDKRHSTGHSVDSLQQKVMSCFELLVEKPLCSQGDASTVVILSK
jgi:hypothetical protein